MLSQHHDIYAASQPGGQLEFVSWYMGTITTHDYLLASMILCLELSQQCPNILAQDGILDGFVAPEKPEMIKMLEQSKWIWDEQDRTEGPALLPALSNSNHREASVVSETQKASKALGIMLSRVQAQGQHTPFSAKSSGNLGSTPIGMARIEPLKGMQLLILIQMYPKEQQHSSKLTAMLLLRA